MTVPAKASKWGLLFDTTDVDATRVHVSRLLCDHFLDHKAVDAAPRFRLRHTSLGRAAFNLFNYELYGGEAHIRVPALTGFYVLELSLSGRSEMQTRKGSAEFGTGQICMLNADQPHDKRWRTDGSQLLLRLESSSLLRALQRLLDSEPRDRLEFEPLPIPADGRAGSLWRYVKLLCAELDAAADGLLSRHAATSAESLLLDLVLETMPNNYSQQLASVRLAPPGFMRRALAYVHERLHDEIAVTDIASAAGVSVRALYAGFERHCGAPPMAYVRGLRLDRVHAALVRGAGQGGRVTELALEHGFNHLGKFARAYTERFGERPSETVARSR